MVSSWLVIWPWDDLEQGRYWLGMWELDKVWFGSMDSSRLVCFWKERSPQGPCYLKGLAGPGRGSLFLSYKAPKMLKYHKIQKIKNMINTYTLLYALHMAVILILWSQFKCHLHRGVFPETLCVSRYQCISQILFIFYLSLTTMYKFVLFYFIFNLVSISFSRSQLH